MNTHDVYVIGIGMHPAEYQAHDFRLEEMVYHTSRRALDHAGISRRQLDNMVIAASDEQDGRPISSMLMTAPAGGYLVDEIKVTDSGAMALCLGYARIRSGEFDVGLIASWCKSSKTDPTAISRFRADPFFLRPVGMEDSIADALLAQSLTCWHQVTEAEVNTRVERAMQRASQNPRGLKGAPITADAIATSDWVATPVREGHIAPLSDGAVSIVIASAKFLRANPKCTPLAKITGAGWATDSYRLGAERLESFSSARRAWGMALEQAGLQDANDFDVLELESRSGWHEAAWIRAFGIDDESKVSPSGGAFAQNPFFCNGLVNAAEAILQVAGQAGPVQRPSVKNAAAHSYHGYAQQGNVVMTFGQAGDI